MTMSLTPGAFSKTSSVFGNFSPIKAKDRLTQSSALGLNFFKKTVKSTAMKGSVIQKFVRNFDRKTILKQKVIINF